MAHTKGKWFYNKRNSTLFEIRNQDEKLIAELESYEKNKQIMGFYELQSNAKIIASAPELFEVLDGLVSDVSNLLSEHDIEWQQAGYYTEDVELIKKLKEKL